MESNDVPLTLKPTKSANVAALISTRESIHGVSRLSDKTVGTGWTRHLKTVCGRFRHGFHLNLRKRAVVAAHNSS